MISRIINKSQLLLIGLFTSIFLLLPFGHALAHQHQKQHNPNEPKQTVPCSPQAITSYGKLCKAPDQFSAGLWVYLSPDAIKNKTNVLKDYGAAPAAGSVNVTWYIYLGGICTVNYIEVTGSASGFGVGCTQNYTLDQVVSNVINAQTWSPNKTKYFIGLEFSPDAINAITSPAVKNGPELAAKAVNKFFYPGGKTNSAFAGLVLDIEGSNPDGTVPLLGPKAAQFADALSAEMPNSQMLNIYAGSVGKLVGDHYVWNLWSAVNRSTNTNCTIASPCQMGVFIPSIYDNPIAEVKNYPEDGKTLHMNSSIQDFPYQMKLISNLSNQYRGMPGNTGGSPTMKPITVPGIGSYSAPFGYYQPALVASGSNNNSAAYYTFDETKAKTMLEGQEYWGGALPMLSGTQNCKQIKGTEQEICTYFQQEAIPPEAIKGGPPVNNFDSLDITNQYLCAQLNAISYVHSNGHALNLEKKWNSHYCNIMQRGTNDAPQKLVFSYLIWGKAGSGTAAASTIYPFVQDGYGTLAGVSLYQITDPGMQKKIIEQCSTNASGKSCLLIPENATIQQGVTNNTWDMFLQWLLVNANADRPAGYVKSIPGR
ncbi:MAG: hypothetical protein P1U63_06785 [Coxiellaceae bacterium]|nr:hypothetical protein [Coxiellaceae bacterium]